MRTPSVLPHRRLLVWSVVGAILVGLPVLEAWAHEDEQRRLALLSSQAPLLNRAAPGAPAQAVVPSVGAVEPAGLEEPTPFPLGPGDELKVTVLGYPELSESQLAILPDGTLSYPLLGPLQAGGLTTQEFSQTLGRALEAHIESPLVSVTVTQMRSRHFSVMGEVTKPGTFPLWNDRLTILEAIAHAGGLTNAAIPSEVTVFQEGPDGARQKLRLNLTELLDGDREADVPSIGPGSVVYVPSLLSRRKVCVLGEVRVPGVYSVMPEMTVIDALSSAGWVKPSARLRNVMVARPGKNGQHEFFKIDAYRAIRRQDWSQHLALQPGDIVYVPQIFISKVGDFVGFFSSKVEPAAGAYLRVYDAANPVNFLVNR